MFSFIAIHYFEEGPEEGEFTAAFSTRGAKPFVKKHGEEVFDPKVERGQEEIVMNFKPDPAGGTRVHLFVRFDIGGKVKNYVTNMMAIHYSNMLDSIIEYIENPGKFKSTKKFESDGEEQPEVAADEDEIMEGDAAQKETKIRKRYGAPNVLITGTPGVGKSKLLKYIEVKLGQKNLFDFKYVKLSKVITQKKLFKEWNEEYNVPEFDEDMVIDHLEPLMTDKGGIVLEFHSCSFFPERWFDLIVLLRTDNSELYERLAKRKYKEKKITENINCEIHGVLKEEVTSSYKKELILEL